MGGEKSSLVLHAEEELRRAGLFDADGDYGGALGPDVLALVEKFSEQGHSGGSAAMVIDLFCRVIRYQPLTPLTGADDEWSACADDLFQNKRMSSVFKNGRDGTAYVIRGDKKVEISFPYTP